MFFTFKQCFLCIFLSRFRREYFFQALLWKKDSYFSRKQWIEANNILKMDLFLTNMQLLITHYVNWWPGVIVDYLSIGEWCNATFLQICSEEETNSSASDDLRISAFSANFHCWVNFSFKAAVIDNELQPHQVCPCQMSAQHNILINAWMQTPKSVTTKNRNGCHTYTRWLTTCIPP